MVQYSEQEHSVDAPLAFVALAHNQRFPSPYATHVISSDVISRSFHPQTNTLRTTRLVLKRGKMPAWAPARVAEVGTSWVLEESELDMEGEQRWLRVRSRNIDHKTVMEVFEWQSFKQMEGDDQQTNITTLTRVTSEFGFWPLRSRIEKFGINRGLKSTEKARQGLALITSLLFDSSTCAPLLSSGPLNPYPFEPLPSSLSLASEAVKARFQAARRKEELLAAKRKELEEYEERVWREEGEPGRVWRERWRRALKRGVAGAKERVCAFTGLLCEKEGEGKEP